MKKLLCLLLALVMVLSLAACSESDSGSKRGKKDKEEEEEVVELEEAIIGTWTVEINFTEEMLGLDGMSIEGIPVTFTFNDEGEVTLGFSDESAEILEEKMLVMMTDMIYAEMEAEGMSRDEVDELFETYYGMSVSDYMVDALKEFGVSDLLAEIEETSEYEVDGDKLTIDGTEMTAEVKGDKLTITECEDDFWGEVALELPVVLKRAK